MTPSPTNQRLAAAQARLQAIQAADPLPQALPSAGDPARMGSMLAGAALQPTAPPAATGPSLLDALQYPGQQAGAYLRNGLGQMQQSVQSTINQSPTLSRLRQFFSDFGGAVSNGVKQSQVIPQAIQTNQSLPDILRQAGR